MSVKPGDVLVAVSHGIGGAYVGPSVKVERVTPSGQVVLAGGTRLKQQRYRDDAYTEMGIGSYGSRWVPEDSDEVRSARHEAARRRRRAAVKDAADAFWRDSSAETAQALIDIAQQYIEGETQ